VTSLPSAGDAGAASAASRSSASHARPAPVGSLPAAAGPLPADADASAPSVTSLPSVAEAGAAPVASRPSSAGADDGGRPVRTGRAIHPSSSRSGRRIAHRALRTLPAGERWRPELGDGLEMDVTARGRAVQLRLAGDLDVASAGRFAAAMSWLRRTGRLVIVDTRHLQFVGLAGDRALRDAAGYDELGRPDPRVVVLVGPAVARFRDLLTRLTAATTAGGTPGPSPATA
jgi:anti-anti-sigma regulatory factor